MGYGYGYNPSTGRQLLACDGCGATGGVRKRTCTQTVLWAMTLGATSRQAVRYCYPPALCSGCFAKAGKTKGVHADCAAGAAVSQREQDAVQAKLDAGDLLVASAFGSWADWVPEGFVGVYFAGLNQASAQVLMPAEDYLQSAFTLAEYRELTDVRDLVAA